MPQCALEIRADVNYINEMLVCPAFPYEDEELGGEDLTDFRNRMLHLTAYRRLYMLLVIRAMNSGQTPSEYYADQWDRLNAGKLNDELPEALLAELREVLPALIAGWDLYLRQLWPDAEATLRADAEHLRQMLADCDFERRVTEHMQVMPMQVSIVLLRSSDASMSPVMINGHQFVTGFQPEARMYFSGLLIACNAAQLASSLWAINSEILTEKQVDALIALSIYYQLPFTGGMTAIKHYHKQTERLKELEADGPRGARWLYQKLLCEG